MTDTTTAVDIIPALVIAFALGTCTYPFYERARGWWERVRPVGWKYRDTCGRQCTIKQRC